ncbi:MAG: hypothetical protein ACI4MI_02515 [Christensenellales bacterium]
MTDKEIEREQRLKESKRLYRKRVRLARQIKREKRSPLPWKEMLLVALLTTKPESKADKF